MPPPSLRSRLLPSWVVVALKSLVLLILVNLVQYIGLVQTGWLRHFVVGPEVYDALTKSQQRVQFPGLLILGDSVCRQMYPENVSSPGLYSLACNQAITLVGHYILLKNFLAANPGYTNREVVLVYHPRSFTSDLRSPFTYNYFLKPFPLRQYVSDLSPEVRTVLSEIPFRSLAHLPMVQTSTWAPTTFPPGITSAHPENPDASGWYFSQVSLDYLGKFKSLAASRHLKLTVRAGFLKEEYRHQDVGRMKLQIKKAGLEEEFSAYFSGMKYLPDEMFIDDVHVRKASLLGPNFLRL